jgi:hypothetical protein
MQHVNKWGAESLAVRATLDERLQLLVDKLLWYMDVSLLDGHRDEREQSTLYGQEKTQVKWPNSKHNATPSLAVDMQPYPRPEKEEELWAGLGYMAGLCFMIAAQHGFAVRWGGDWNRNGSVADNNFDDLFHIEIYNL